jgi:muramoyltetrapeptide carboxypeptidase
MVAAELARGLTADEESSLLAALAGRYPMAHPVRFLREPEDRVAAGTFLGGCLSLLVSLLGTPFFPDLRGALLFWEDVNEPRYKIDRMLTHFRLSGHLAAIEGMIVGHLGWTEGADKEAADSIEWPALVEQSVAGFDWPLVWGLDSGHLRPNRTLPLGLLTHLDARTGEIVFGEFGEH